MPWHGYDAERRRRSLRVEHVSKTYPSGVRALTDVSLSFERGLCALLGADGSGKSTLLHVIAALQPPDEGCVHFRDVDAVAHPHRLRRVVSCVMGDLQLVPVVPVRVALEHFARLQLSEGHVTGEPAPSAADVESLLDRVGLTGCQAQHVGELSLGMMRRLGIAVALVTNPELLLLDEPLNGLTPDERSDLRALMVDIAQEMLVLFTTADPDDLTLQCAEVALLCQGRLLLEGATDRIVDDLRGRVWLGTVPRGQLEAMSEQHEIVDATAVGDQVTVRVLSDEELGSRFTMVEPTLADAYWHLIDTAETK